MTTFSPDKPEDVLAAVAWAAAEEAPLELIGRGTKRAIGRPAQTEHTLDLSRLSGVTLYEPAELVLSARAGTPLAGIEQLLAENNQQLAFEPMDYGPVLGEVAGGGTIGGVLLANLSGPRRVKAGAARDHILGVNCVSGRGELFKSGGRVVKNVTGYDLSKLMAHSWGTLAAITDVTFKVLPAAETECTLAVRGLLDEDAATVMAVALGSTAEAASAAHLPESIASLVLDNQLGSDAATLIRLEGVEPSVAFRMQRLKDLLLPWGESQIVEHTASRDLWRAIRDVVPFARDTHKPLWRMSANPGDGWKIVLALRMEMAAQVFYDWQGGLIWLQIEGDDPEADLVRRVVKKAGGHATLVRASPAIRAAVSVFQPEPSALAALTRRVKDQFDPRGILNPGRMA